MVLKMVGVSSRLTWNWREEVAKALGTVRVTLAPVEVEDSETVAPVVVDTLLSVWERTAEEAVHPRVVKVASELVLWFKAASLDET